MTGRVCGGVVVAGERLRIVPGDESATVKAIDNDGDSLQWAGAGSNVNLTLTGVDPISLNIGSVLCRPTSIVPLVSSFTAKIIVFDIQIPITAGTSVRYCCSFLSTQLTTSAGRALPPFARRSRLHLPPHLGAGSFQRQYHQKQAKVCIIGGACAISAS